MLLPPTNILPVRYLSSVFNKTTNSYKFYWFLAIMESVNERTNPVISLSELLARMIASVWYPVNYFRISFGKQDRLGNIALKIKAQSELKANAGEDEVFSEVIKILARPSSKQLSDDLASLMRYVPYRFLRPWFTPGLRGVPDYKINSQILYLAEHKFSEPENTSLYRFIGKEKHIEIAAGWFEYLRRHRRILTDFCYWNLLTYLEKNNPNVPNIAGKLFAPQVRSLASARKYWHLVLREDREFRCIYSDAQISEDEFSIDHFVPWRFVTHDLLWNLVPVSKFVNSVKSDSLPSLDQYFSRFAMVQHEAFRTAFGKNKTKMLEDYANLYQRELKEICEMPMQKFAERLRSTVAPLVQIAENMGFQSGWVFKR